MGKEITFKYKFEDNYNPKYVNGCQGGSTPQGEIVLNFYFERLPIPNTETRILDAKTGALGDTINMEPKDYSNSIIRYLDSGVILSLDFAKTLHKWLGIIIEDHEKNIKKIGENK